MRPRPAPNEGVEQFRQNVGKKYNLRRKRAVSKAMRGKNPFARLEKVFQK